MTERISKSRALAAALLAAALSYALALAVSWQLLAAARGQPGLASTEVALLALQDLPRRWAWGLLLLAAIGLCTGLAAGLRRLLAWPRWLVHPVAGVLAMALALGGPLAVFGLAPLAGVHDWPGALLYLAAGLLGGLVGAGTQALLSRREASVA